MSQSRFESMKQGLTQALEYAQGDKTKCRVKKVRLEVQPLKEYTPDEVKALRNENNISQRLFAEILGVTPQSVEAWEAGKTRPSGTAIRLFQLIEKDKRILDELLVK